MWYIFPQFRGLGFSDTSKFYAITDIDGAKEYLDHPVLGFRLRKVSKQLLLLAGNNAFSTFGSPDDLKLRSCMTLFAVIGNTEEKIFLEVLGKFFRDSRQTDSYFDKRMKSFFRVNDFVELRDLVNSFMGMKR